MEATRKPPRPPEDHFVRYGPAPHRTFYRQGGISVTDQWLTIAGRRFPVAELHNLRSVREPAPTVAVATAAVACAVAVATGALAAFSGDPALMIGAPFLAALPIGMAVATWRLRPRYFALYADYRGEIVQLLGAVDERRYGQICRALLRAVEVNRERTY